MKYAIGVGIPIWLALIGVGQAQIPSVDALIKEHDTNKDGVLTAEEVAKTPRFKRQFSRWDADQNGKVDAREIIAFRRRFGIGADGTRPENATPTANEFVIPDVKELPRIGANERPDRNAAVNSAFLLKTEPHEVSGTQYVVLTDQTSEESLAALEKLARYRHGTLLKVDDLAAIHEQPKAWKQLHDDLLAAKAKYVAIAPRKESFRENMLLGMWELLSTLDDDPQIDALPGLLLASTPKALEKLIDQSIAYQPLTSSLLKPMAISQVQSTTETRSLQKAGILRKHFSTYGLKTPIVAIYHDNATEAPHLEGEQTWDLTVKKRDFVKAFPTGAQKSFDESTLIVMHGHGIPGMSCSVDIEGLPSDLSGKILMSGSCFSVAPWKSDLVSMGKAPGDYDIEQRDAFVIRSIDNGAIVAFGHQRLSSGFPHLYPVLETWLQGGTVGQAYQQLLNGLIDQAGVKSGDFIIGDSQRNERNPRQARLLYVLIGDPALQPYEKLE